jgi:hypothetical protein
MEDITAISVSALHDKPATPDVAPDHKKLRFTPAPSVGASDESGAAFMAATQDASALEKSILKKSTGSAFVAGRGDPTLTVGNSDPFAPLIAAVLGSKDLGFNSPAPAGGAGGARTPLSADSAETV